MARTTDMAELDEVIAREMERGRVPGLAIALVRGDEIVWSKGYGYADLAAKTPFTPSTVFSAQSVSKPVVATALMQWHERGRFGLDDPVNQHLAPFRIENEWEERAPVTIRRLLTHSAGLPVDLGATAQGEGGLPSLKEFVASVAKTVRPPGDEIVYSNFGYDIAGYLVERLSGGSFGEYVREHVLEPLNMRASRFGQPPDGVTIARSYFFSVIDGEYHGASHDFELAALARPAGSLLSTAEDLARFLIAHLNGGLYQGGRVLREETVAAMHRVQAACGGPEDGMGLGFRVGRRAGRTLTCHGGDGVGATIFVGALPEESVAVALMMNLGRAYTARSVIGEAALRLLLGERPELVPGVAAVHSARIGGRYRSNFWGYDAIVRTDSGAPAIEIDDGAALHRTRLESIADGVYRADGGFFAGAELTFASGPDGEPLSFTGGLYPWRFDRVGDIPPPLVVDAGAAADGRWNGAIASPLGPVPMALTIAGHSATVTTLSASQTPVEEFAAENGRVAGWFDVSVPGVGDLRVFLRLVAVDGKLRGKAYARGPFGETGMEGELARALESER